MSKMLPRLIGEHIAFAFHAASDLPPVKADPGQIEQVIMNLAVNARDAMPDGGTLIVQTRRVTVNDDEARRRPMPAGSYVVLSVKDSGHGMDAATQTHIFEPFFTTKAVGKGTGLGLATVYGIVKQSGGFIWVESALGKGATFEIYLPPSAESIGTELQPKSPAIQRGSETVLLVEDEDAIRDLACQFLRKSGYSVLLAKDGLEAMEAARTHHGAIHLLLTDIVMPRMGGAILAERMTALRPSLKVVLMSGYAEYSSDSSAGRSKFPILQKPFSFTSLVQTVGDALNDNPGLVREQRQLVT
jgi:CheY-like chemotaxis protein